MQGATRLHSGLRQEASVEKVAPRYFEATHTGMHSVSHEEIRMRTYQSLATIV